MSKGRRNIAFGNDEDLEIEYVSKESTTKDKEPRPQSGIAIDPIGDLETGLISKMRDDPASTRHEAMVDELSVFAKQSPETVAAIIKNWFREDN